MSRLTPLKAIQVIRILKILGFEQIRHKGTSHIRFRHPDGRVTTVPFHKGEDIGRGLLKEILKDIEVDWEEFIRNK